VEHRDTVELLLSGKKVANPEGSFKRFCIVGHTEVQRRDIDGLILKVSKRKWAQIGTSTMYLLRIGANITALREFTALCGVEATPLKRFLLCHHLTEKASVGGSSRGSLSNTANIRKEVLLKKMGGVQALGKGFTDYAEKKFNPSQLMAISASSTGYGEGEFSIRIGLLWKFAGC
jgi:senataxin